MRIPGWERQSNRLFNPDTGRRANAADFGGDQGLSTLAESLSFLGRATGQAGSAISKGMGDVVQGIEQHARAHAAGGRSVARGLEALGQGYMSKGEALKQGHKALDRGIADVGSSMQQLSMLLLKRQEEQDVANVRAWEARARAQKTIQLAQLESSPDAMNDPEFAKHFADNLDKELHDNSYQPTTRAGKETMRIMSSQLFGDLYERAGLAQVKMAGVRAQRDFTQRMIDREMTLTSDPTQLSRIKQDFVEEQADPASMFSRMDPEARIKFQLLADTRFTTAALNGRINRNPEEAVAVQKELNAGMWDRDLTPEIKDQLLKDAQQMLNATYTEMQHARVLKEQTEKEQQEQRWNQLFPDIVAGKATPTQIMRDPVLNARYKDMALQKFKQYQQMDFDPTADNITNWHTINEYDKALYLPRSDPNRMTIEKLDNIFRNGGIPSKVHDYLRNKAVRLEQLSKEGKPNTDTQDMNRAASLAEKLFKASPVGTIYPDTAASAAYRFRFELNERWDKYKSEGKDPRALINPKNPDYMLTPSRVQSYMPRMEEVLAQNAAEQSTTKKNELRAGQLVEREVDGIKRKFKFKGGDANNKENWEEQHPVLNAIAETMKKLVD